MNINNLKISILVLQKLFYKHKVSRAEIEECFLNRSKGLLIDKREKHGTIPPTQWFIAETNKGRLLKIVFIDQGQTYEVKTAYEPNQKEVKIYEKFA